MPGAFDDVPALNAKNAKVLLGVGQQVNFLPAQVVSERCGRKCDGEQSANTRHEQCARRSADGAVRVEHRGHRGRAAAMRSKELQHKDEGDDDDVDDIRRSTDDHGHAGEPIGTRAKSRCQTFVDTKILSGR